MKDLFFIKAFGCKLNQYHAMVLRQNLLAAGFDETNFPEKAKYCIAVACVVTEKAEKEVLALLRKWKKQNKEVFSAGCFGQILSSILRSESIFFGSETEVFSYLLEKSTIKDLNYMDSLEDPGQKSRAFVKIQQGCNQFCSYCIVPFTRGKPFSRNENKIMNEIEVLYRQGIKEIVLTGTQIGLYRQEQHMTEALCHLMHTIEQRFSGKLFRARLSSIHPNFVSPMLIKFMSTSALWCNHLHISLQSGSDKVLKAMNRQYTSAEYHKIIQLARQSIPGFLVTTDLIVGFPGESQEDFNTTCQFIQQVQFSKIHLFPYSQRKESFSSYLKDSIHPEEIQMRKRKLLELSKKLSYNLNGTFIGKMVEVLIESDCTGFTRNYKKVILNKGRPRSLHTINGVIVADCNEEVLFEG